MSQHGYPASCRLGHARSAAAVPRARIAGAVSGPAFLRRGRRASQAVASRSWIRPAAWRTGPSRERLLPVPEPAAWLTAVDRVHPAVLLDERGGAAAAR